ncbi:NUDIX domain-containing protein [Halomarina pelagica]|uniref:NUDIX domain-containing protein n=1 Tax=Halomarina pelagica TaxID=2961599 RepID=UPI0020C4DCF9|nr:NUDIX domain-containing protein [Halomarina sp. BND7]
MSVYEESRAQVGAVIRRLAEEHGEFEVIDKTWEHPRTRHEAIVERYENGGLGGGGVWLTNERGEVLLVRNVGDDGWADPGGKVEPGETHERAAKREVREEAGVDCRITGVLEVHWIENRCVEGDAPAVCEAIVIFTGKYVDGKPRPREGEIAEVGWFSAPPEEVLYEEVRTRSYSEIE